jgi:hypothetical protein
MSFLYGLKWYGFYVVEHSPLIREIAERNSVHPNHKRSHFDSFYHCVITFHDETLEVIAGKATVLGEGELPAGKAVTDNYHCNAALFPDSRKRVDDQRDAGQH